MTTTSSLRVSSYFPDNRPKWRIGCNWYSR